MPTWTSSPLLAFASLTHAINYGTNRPVADIRNRLPLLLGAVLSSADVGRTEQGKQLRDVVHPVESNNW